MTNSTPNLANMDGFVLQRQPTIDPDRIAHYEKSGWEAYYNRQWLRVLRLILQLNREQFGMPRLTSLAAAIDVVRAGLAFAPVDNDVPRARKHLQRYYDKALRSAGIQKDSAALAALEVDYWVIHRNLSDERRLAADHSGDIQPMVEALVLLHAALFDASPEAIRISAEQRALAAKAVDRITGNYSPDVAGDWAQVEQHLQQAYRALHANILGGSLGQIG